MTFSATMLLVGIVVFRIVATRSVLDAGDAEAQAFAERAARSSRGIGSGVAVGLIAVSGMRLGVQVMTLAGGDPWRPLVTAVALHTSWGRGWMVGLVGAASMFAYMRVGKASLAAIGVVLLAVSPALTGHAIASPTHAVIAVIADATHVLGASAWLGTLLVIVVVGMPASAVAPESRARLIARTVTGFSPIALGGALAVGLSGALNGLLRVDHVALLWTTLYGGLLLAKVGLFVLIGAVGAYNWRRVTPRMTGGGGVDLLRRSALAELTLAAVVLGVTAVFVGTDLPM